MKTRIHSFTFFVFVLLISCAKKVERSSETTEKVLQEASTVSSDAMRQVYGEIAPSEKYSLWKRHFDYWQHSQSDAGRSDLITSLQNSLSEAVFEDDSEEKRVFLNYTLPMWLGKAKEMFTAEEIFEITMQNKFISVQSNFEPSENRVDCFCHVGNTGYSCKKFKFTFPWAIEVTYGMCEAPNDCHGTRFGCGALWLESCSGAHCNW